MKTKVILLIAVSAITTLSFTFASVKSDSKKVKAEQTTKNISMEPIGGFIAKDKI